MARRPHRAGQRIGNTRLDSELRRNRRIIPVVLRSTHLTKGARPVRRLPLVLACGVAGLAVWGRAAILPRTDTPMVRTVHYGPDLRPPHVPSGSQSAGRWVQALNAAVARLPSVSGALYTPTAWPPGPAQVAASAYPGGHGYSLVLGSSAIDVNVSEYVSPSAATVTLTAFQQALTRHLRVDGDPPHTEAPAVAGTWWRSVTRSPHEPGTGLDFIGHSGSVWYKIAAPKTNVARAVGVAAQLVQMASHEPLPQAERAIVTVTLWPQPNRAGASMGLEIVWNRGPTEIAVTADAAPGTARGQALTWDAVWHVAASLVPRSSTPAG